MICKTLKKIKPVVVKDNPVVSAMADLRGLPHFFYISGHNSKRQGTVNYLGESENPWANRIGSKLQISMQDTVIPIHLIERPSIGGYSHECRAVANKIKKITKGEISFGYNSHFNSTDGGKGSEGLVAKGTRDNFDNFLADIFTDKLAEIGIKQRHGDGVFLVDKKHNGAGMLDKMSKVNCTSIIGEPCFDYKYAESIAIFEFEDRFVEILKQSILEAYRKRGYLV